LTEKEEKINSNVEKRIFISQIESFHEVDHDLLLFHFQDIQKEFPGASFSKLPKGIYNLLAQFALPNEIVCFVFCLFTPQKYELSRTCWSVFNDSRQLSRIWMIVSNIIKTDVPKLMIRELIFCNKKW
jgi:hypothetical protein